VLKRAGPWGRPPYSELLTGHVVRALTCKGMPRIALFCPPTQGHLNPMTLLGRTLHARGHAVTLFGIEDVRAKAESCGLGFQVLAPGEYPAGSLERTTSVLGGLSGLTALALHRGEWPSAGRTLSAVLRLTGSKPQASTL